MVLVMVMLAVCTDWDERLRVNVPCEGLGEIESEDVTFEIFFTSVMQVPTVNKKVAVPSGTV